jgi:hypothetical protein
MTTRLGHPVTAAPGGVEISVDAFWPMWQFQHQEPFRDGRALGRQGVAILDGGAATTTQVCDRLWLLYNEVTVDGADSRGGVLEVRVDGDLVAEIPCGQADVLGRIWDSGPLGELRARTVELRAVGGFASVGQCYFHGLHDDTAPVFWRCARSGFSIADDPFGFGDPRELWAGAFTRRPLGRNRFSGARVYGAGSIEPDCILCCTGTNDIGRFDGDASRLAAAYEDVIALLRSRCDNTPSIGVIVPTMSTSVGGARRALAEGIYTACERSGAFVIDVGHALSGDGDDRSGYLADGKHPNDRGHAAWAAYVASWLLAAVGEPSGL